MRSVVRSSSMRRVFLAFGLFRTAEMATWVALLVWAFDRGGAAASGAIAVAQLVPATLAAPLGSVLADRMPRPRALRLGYLLQAATNLATAGALFLDAPFWAVAALAGFAASAMTLTRPVHHALVPEIARTPDELTAGNTASTGVEGIADFVGPALAGGMLVVSSAGWVFVAMGLAGLLSVAMTRHLTVLQVAVSDEPATYWQDAVEGLRTVAADPPARILTVLAGGEFLFFGLLDILAVVLALELLGTGPAGPGLITSALGIGALVGAALSVTLIGRRRLTPALAIGVVLAGGPIALVAVTNTLVAAVLLFVVAGAGLAYASVAARTLLQRNVAPRVLSRVFGVHESLMMAGTALGSAAVPLLIVLFGARGAFIASSALLPLVVLLTWARLRRLDRTSVLPGPGLELLRQVPMFAVLPQPQLEQLVASLEPVAPASAGEIVISQGDAGDCWYLIVSGSVEVEVDGHHVATLGPGQGFGEIALLRDVPRTATVRAREPLELATVGREPFLVAVTGSESSYATVAQDVDGMLTRNRSATAGEDPSLGSQATDVDADVDAADDYGQT